VKKKHFIFIIKNNNNNRKHIKINIKKKSLKKKLKHEPNIVEITHLCIRHGVQTSIIYMRIGCCDSQGWRRCVICCCYVHGRFLAPRTPLHKWVQADAAGGAK
jgi:hypothetical protein